MTVDKHRQRLDVQNWCQSVMKTQIFVLWSPALVQCRFRLWPRLVNKHLSVVMYAATQLCLPCSPLLSGHVRGQRVWPLAGQGTLSLRADQWGRTLVLQGRHHQCDPAGGRGLVGRLVQRQVWVVPQQLCTGAERRRWVQLLLLRMLCFIHFPVICHTLLMLTPVNCTILSCVALYLLFQNTTACL